MNPARKVVFYSLLAGGVLCLLAAGFLWMVSDAHGHGLASNDRMVITILTALGVMDLLLAGFLVLLNLRR